MATSVRAGSERSEQLDATLLPNRERLRTWAGHGTGAICNGCGGAIEVHEVEYEIEMPQGSDASSLHFHFVCYRNWTGRGIR